MSRVERTEAAEPGTLPADAVVPPGWTCASVRRRTARFALRGLAALMLVPLAAGCRAPWAEAPLVIAFGESRITLDPHLGNRNVAWSVLASVCDPLVAFSPEMSLQSALAMRWEQPDSTHWRFTLRPGVTFSDGSPLTAADVVASLERARTHPDSSVRYYLTGVRAVGAADDATVAIETVGPVPDLLNRLTFVLVLPAAQTAQRRVKAPIGTGSYRLLREESDGTILLRGWPGWRGQPEIQEVRFEFAGSGEETVRRLLAATADVCHRVPDGWLSEVDATRGVRLVEQPRLAVQLLGIHPESATGDARRALADRRVRRALLLALDRPAWIRRIFRGNGTVATQFVHPAVTGFDPGLEAVPFDPVEARRLLAEAGFAGGFAVELATGAASDDLIAAIATDLSRVGITAIPAAATSGRGLGYFAWSCGTGDASDFLNSMVWRPGPLRGVAVPADDPLERVAELASRADLETDPTRRLALLQEAQRLLLDQLPVLPLTIRWGYKGVSDRVEIVTRYDERVLPASFRWRR